MFFHSVRFRHGFRRITAANQETQSVNDEVTIGCCDSSKRGCLSLLICAIRYNLWFLLLLLLFTQAEIVAEHGLERFILSMLKVIDVRRANRPERGSNFLHVRALLPDREARAS